MLGRIAFDSYLRVLAKREGFPRRSTLVFSHGANEEFRKLLDAHGIAYDKRYVWD